MDNVALFGPDRLSKCPTCGFPIRPVYKSNGYLDSYVPELDQNYWDQNNIRTRTDTYTERQLRKERNGKKTVAMVGWSPQSCGLAPYNEPNIHLNGMLEIWSLNQIHAMAWFKNWTRWFQMHKSDSYMRQRSLRGVLGHYDWLKQDHGENIIYMQFKHDEIPNSVEYPLVEVTQKYLSKIKKGKEIVKYFTSTFAFMVPIAIMEGFQRIELYGFEMTASEEWAPQKACAEFWIGFAAGKGLEIYLPEGNHLLEGPIYGYQGKGANNVA